MADSDQDQPEQRKSYTGKVVVWLVVAVLAIILILQNANKTRIDIYFWDVTVRLWVLLLGTLLVGMFLGWFLSKLRRSRKERDQSD